MNDYTGKIPDPTEDTIITKLNYNFNEIENMARKGPRNNSSIGDKRFPLRPNTVDKILEDLLFLYAERKRLQDILDDQERFGPVAHGVLAQARARIADIEETVIKRETYISQCGGRISELEKEVLELLELVLMENSYEHDSREGWFHHSCMVDQEGALARLVRAGVYELHPDNIGLFRKKIQQIKK